MLTWHFNFQKSFFFSINSFYTPLWTIEDILGINVEILTWLIRLETQLEKFTSSGDSWTMLNIQSCLGLP
jgi:hypothetical protein